MLLADFLEWRRRTRRQANAPGGGAGGGGGRGRREEPPPPYGSGRLDMLLDAARHLEQRDTEPQSLTRRLQVRAAAWRLPAGRRGPLPSPSLPPQPTRPSALRSDADPLLSAGFYPLDEPEPAPETAAVPESGAVPAPVRAAPRIEVTPASAPSVVSAPPDSQPARRGPGRAAPTWASMVGADWASRAAGQPGDAGGTVGGARRPSCRNWPTLPETAPSGAAPSAVPVPSVRRSEHVEPDLG